MIKIADFYGFKTYPNRHGKESNQKRHTDRMLLVWRLKSSNFQVPKEPFPNLNYGNTYISLY